MAHYLYLAQHGPLDPSDPAKVNYFIHETRGRSGRSEEDIPYDAMREILVGFATHQSRRQRVIVNGIPEGYGLIRPDDCRPLPSDVLEVLIEGCPEIGLLLEKTV